MWYVLRTSEGNEESTRQMIETHIDRRLFTRCIVPYRKKRHFHQGRSWVIQQLLFPSYVFIETDHIDEFMKRIQWYPGRNMMLTTDELCCPIYSEEEYFLTKLLNEQDVIDISEGYVEGDRLHVISGPLVGQEEHIKKVVWRNGVAILEMNFFNRTNRIRLGLDKTDGRR
ncbi:MAG: antiterminator LoaP [Flexilinea sp.]|nr:antiterminator LoaP [Flexilinea sp.]